MNNSINEAIWKQFGAGLEMLENAILKCPVEHWNTETKFWYNAYHCIFWTDYYLTVEPSTFAPPLPFDFSEFDPSGILPNTVYSKKELLDYLQYCKEKAYQLITTLSDERLNTRWVNDYKKLLVIRNFVV